MDHRTTEAPEQRTVTPAPQTPLPWETTTAREWVSHSCCYYAAITAFVDGRKSTIGEAFDLDDAAFIVRSVNSHDALMKALEEIASLRGGSDETDMAREIARAALAALEGGK